MNFTCEKSTARVYKLRMTGQFGGWADVTIEEWPRGGSIKAVTDYGDYAYIWNATGSKTFREFLIGLDYSYFMGKAHPSHGREFDPGKSAEGIKNMIFSDRKAGLLSKHDAKIAFDYLMTIWDELKGCCVNEFFHIISESDLLELVFGNDFHGVPHCSRRHPQCDGFWEHVWPCLKEVWSKELKDDEEEDCVEYETN